MRNLAYLCRYTNQDFFRLQGRDPITSPLTPVERVVFLRVTEQMLAAEFGKEELPDEGDDEPEDPPADPSEGTP